MLDKKVKKQVCIVDLSTWRAQELSTVSVIEHSFGLWIPEHTTETVWWMPQAIASYFNQSLSFHNLPELKLNTPGSRLLLDTDQKFLQRSVVGLTVSQLEEFPYDGWWKPATAKIDAFPAAYYSFEEVKKLIIELALPAATELHYTATTLPIVEEHRCFIVNKKVVAQSLYRKVYEDGVVKFFDDDIEDIWNAEVKIFAEKVAQALHSSPNTYTMDIVRLSDGSYAVLEYNPTWCSGWYNCSLTGVLEALSAVQDDTQEWRWLPDAYHVRRSASWQPLPLAPVSKAK